MSECGKQIKNSVNPIHYSSAVSRAMLIEQIGTLKANKMKCPSSTAEKREMEEQSQAYKFQIFPGGRTWRRRRTVTQEGL
jgi:hypothetical protein